MLSVAALCFFVAAVTLAKRDSRVRLGFAGALALLALALNLAHFGAPQGVVMTLVLAITSAALLVLVLPPRPQLALPLACSGTALGLLMVGAHWVMS